jgi:hypothetical protein
VIVAPAGAVAMNLVFTDSQFSYQLLRLMGNAAWGGSDIERQSFRLQD